MITFELRKPLYEWRVLGPGEGSNLFLNDEVKNWLVDQNIDYSYHVEHEKRDQHTYLIFYLDIEDHNQAMLFKLTWL